MEKLIVSLFIVSFFSYADNLKELTNVVKDLCTHPEEIDSHILVSGGGKLNIKFLNSGLKGNITQEKWKGIQRVLKKQQLNENKNYRQCVKDIFNIIQKHNKYYRIKLSKNSNSYSDKVSATSTLEQSNKGTASSYSSANSSSSSIGQFNKGTAAAYASKKNISHSQAVFNKGAVAVFRDENGNLHKATAKFDDF